MLTGRLFSGFLCALALALAAATLIAQVAPRDAEVRAYQGLHAAAAAGNVAEIERLLAAGADREARDGNGRRPLHVAVYRKQRDAARLCSRRAPTQTRSTGSATTS